MPITLLHHPHSRAATVVWMLEELGLAYDLRFIDLVAGAQKTPDVRSLNPMGKLPVLIDGDAVVTEVAAIGLYLADRYAAGRLAPALDDARRATYLRWSLFAPSVIEPAAAAKASGGQFRPGSVGWGTYEEMLDSIEHALRPGPYLVGETFTMADIIFGSTLRWLVGFKMIEARPAFARYVELISSREGSKKAAAVNERVKKEHGIS